MKYKIGIDIGSTGSKTAVLDENNAVIDTFVMATGWNSVETANKIYQELQNKGYAANSVINSTGYGRRSVPFAQKNITEITCHALGAVLMSGKSDFTVIDIGGQDTKIIEIKDRKVIDFMMNDKCSAGTGRFLEIMASTLGLSLTDLFSLAESGSGVHISSLCTVFAESEVISLVGKGEKKENIAFAVVNSISRKVATQAKRLIKKDASVFLTGGLYNIDYIRKSLETELKCTITPLPYGRYAGAIGAAAIEKE